MIQYEYKIRRFFVDDKTSADTELVKELNIWGAAGWQVIECVPVPGNVGAAHWKLLLQRPIE